MKNILFLVEHNSHFRAPLLLIKKLKSEKRFNPIVFFCLAKGYDLSNEIAVCKEYDVEFLSDFHEEQPTDCQVNSINVPSIGKKAKGLSFGQWRNFIKNRFYLFFLIRFYYNYIKNNVKILKKNKIDILVLPEDNVPSIACFVRAAKKIKIPSVVVPFTLSNENEFLTCHKLFPINTIWKKSLYSFFSKWKFKYNEIGYSTKSIGEVLIMELLKIAPEQPWITMGGLSDYILAESSYIASYYEKAKIREAKIITTGAIYHDIIYNKFKDYAHLKIELYKKYSLDFNKPIMLCGLHPVYSDPNVNYEKTGLFEEAVAKSNSENFDFKTLGEMTDFWVKSMTEQKNYQVIIHNHPRTNLEKVKYIESFGVKIVEGDITDFLPFCDIYVSGVSATIRMAIACGKPVICYTMGFYYKDYDHFKAVFKVSSREEYKEIIQKITSDQEFYDLCKKNQESIMADFGIMDNKSGDRINSFLESIVN